MKVKFITKDFELAENASEALSNFKAQTTFLLSHLEATPKSVSCHTCLIHGSFQSQEEIFPSEVGVLEECPHLLTQDQRGHPQI